MTSGKELTPTRRSIRRDVVALESTPVTAHPRAGVPRARWSRRRGVLGVFAAFAAVGFVVAYVGPTGVAISQANAEVVAPVSLYASSLADVQSHTVSAAAAGDAAPLDRGGYTVYVKPKPKPKPVVVTTTASSSSGSSSGWSPPFVAPDPGSAQAIAYPMVLARGWNDAEFGCLVALWNKESGWRVNAYNAGSGAYGIPQSLPGSKMASVGADWETNPATQITWGLNYIGGRYGSPCGAWGHSQSVGWY